jgi:photosystem II stability/assembly factor-like uncharacterized protein
MTSRRRAIALIVLSVIVIAVAAVAYLQSSGTPLSVSQFGSGAGRPSVQRLGDVVSYAFVTPLKGWSIETTVSPSSWVGPFWILRTLDGARTWQKQLSGNTAIVWITISSLKFLDPNDGFVVAGNPLRLYRTTDGGAHWTTLELPSQDTGLVTFGDVKNGWLEAESRTNPPSYAGARIFRTRDGGESWARLPNPPNGLCCLAVRQPQELWAGARGPAQTGFPAQPHVYVSSDGGETWGSRELPPPPEEPPGSWDSAYPEMLPIAGVVATVVYGSADLAATSFDGGASWRNATIPTAPPYGIPSSDAYQDAFHWWAIAGSTLYKSSDAGQTWSPIAHNLPSGLYLLEVLDSRNAWARFSYPTGTGLSFTSDGGLHWAPRDVPISD